MALNVAFLRAINVGGRVVKMERLRIAFEEAGFANVSTFIASGNVVFERQSGDSAEDERAIEAHLRASLGFEVTTYVRTDDEVRDIAAYRPFPGPEESYYIGFLKAVPDAEAERRILELNSPREELSIRGRELYWRSQSSISESRISGGAIEKALGMSATLRNVNTVRRLAARLAI